MNRLKQILAILLISTLACCYQSDQLSQSDKERIVVEVTEMFKNYHSDISKDGLTAEFKYLDQSNDFFWVPPGYTSALSYDSVRSILEINAKSFESLKYSWDTLQIFPLSNKIANYTGIVKGSMTDTSGTRSSVSLIESGTVIKRADSWKLLSGQTAFLN